MLSEVAEVGSVECRQRHLVAQAAGGDPGVVLWLGPSPQLGCTGQLAPYPGYLAVVGNEGALRGPGIQAATPVLSPPADHCPLGQLPYGDEGQPDPGTSQMAKNPWRCLVLL